MENGTQECTLAERTQGAPMVTGAVPFGLSSPLLKGPATEAAQTQKDVAKGTSG